MVLQTTVKMTSGLAVDIDKHTRDGSQLLQQGELEKAKQYFELAFRSSQQYSDGFTERACAFNLGAVYIALKQPEHGLEMLQRAIPPMNQRDGKSNGDLYYNFGLGYEMLKNDSEAVKFFELAYEEYKSEKDNARMETDTVVKAGGLYSKLRSPLQAARCYGLAAVGLAQLQDFTQQSLCLCKQALHLLQCNRIDEGAQVADDCMVLCQRITPAHLLGKLYNELGLIYSQCHEFPKAATCFEFALPISQGPEGEKKKQAIILQNLGAVYNSLGDYQRALNFHERAAALHAELGDRGSQGQCFINLAFAYSQLGDKDSAGECYLHALQAGKDMTDKQTQWQALEGLGAVAFNSEDVDKAISYFKQALATLAASGAVNNMAQERIVMKLTDALQIQLSKQSPVDPNNVRVPSALSTSSGVTRQAVYQNVQKGAPPLFVNDLPRPPTREEQRQMSELRSQLQRTRPERGGSEFDNIALGVSDYNTDDDLSIPGGNRNPANRPRSAKPRSRTKPKPPRPSVGHDTPDADGSVPFSQGRVHAAIVEEVTSQPPAGRQNTDYSKYNTGKRLSKTAQHINGLGGAAEFHDTKEPNEDLRRRVKPSLLRTETHDSEEEWRVQMKDDRHSHSEELTSDSSFFEPKVVGNRKRTKKSDCFSFIYGEKAESKYKERLRPPSTGEESEDHNEPTAKQHQQTSKGDKRDKILRMLKGDTYKQHSRGESSSDDAMDRPRGLSSATARVRGPTQQKSTSSSTDDYAPNAGESENSQQLESTGTNEALREYQRRIRRLSIKEENPEMHVSSSGSETGSESETDSGTSDEQQHGNNVPPPAPNQPPPNTMLANTYEEPIPVHQKPKRTGVNYFRADADSDYRAPHASSPERGSQLKQTLRDPDDPDYATIRTLRQGQGDWHTQGLRDDSPQPGPSTEAPPLPPRGLRFEDMSRAEERHSPKRQVIINEEGKNDKPSSKTCVVM